MKGNIVQVLSEIAQATGLNRETIKDLMKKGWFFEKQADSNRMAFFSPDPKKR